ncbi:chemotaxis protein CheW [Vibrio sp.]|nr:chemotaxis protein CheW [Vibrio sp.]
MDKLEGKLTSEQALDDYFFALLDDMPTDELSDGGTLSRDDVNISQTEFDVQHQQSPIQSQSFVERPYADDVADIERIQAVEKLLEHIDASVIAPALPESNRTDPILESTEKHDVSVSCDDALAVKDYETVIKEHEAAVKIHEVAVKDHEIESLESIQESLDNKDLIGVGELPIHTEYNPLSIEPKEVAFQALFFTVSGVTFAVSLDELGGIKQFEELSHLIGRPEWYLGLYSEEVDKRIEKYDVVDTARWVMPDRIDSENYKDNYSYLILLGKSQWGLACDSLIGTELIAPDEVQWRKSEGKRPWLAGMVKEKMCALIHVDALIFLLQSGLDISTLETMDS